MLSCRRIWSVLSHSKNKCNFMSSFLNNKRNCFALSAGLVRFVAFTKEKHSIKLYKTMFSITWLYKKMPGWHTNICTTLYKEPHTHTPYTPLQLKLCTVIQVYLMIRLSHNGHMTHHVYYLIYTCGIIKFCGAPFVCEFRRLAVP